MAMHRWVSTAMVGPQPGVEKRIFPPINEQWAPRPVPCYVGRSSGAARNTTPLRPSTIPIMKTLLLRSLAGFACLLLLTASAEDSRPVKRVQFKDAKVLAFRDDAKGEVTTNDIVLAGSAVIKVTTNGTFTVGSGKARDLLEGQILGADGNLTSLDGTVVPVEDHIAMKGGKLMLVRDGESTKAAAEVLLGDGTRVKPDGTIKGPDGRLRRMLDGQITRFSGATIAATDTVTVKDGQVILQKDGGKVILKSGQTIAMSNGSKVSSDGTVTRMDGTKTKVAEGEIYKLPGILPAKR